MPSAKGLLHCLLLHRLALINFVQITVLVFVQDGRHIGGYRLTLDFKDLVDLVQLINGWGLLSGQSALSFLLIEESLSDLVHLVSFEYVVDGINLET